MSALGVLRAARAAGSLREIDVQLARHLLSLASKPSAALAQAIAALSRAQGNGDICLDLAACAGTKLFGAESQQDGAAHEDREADAAAAGFEVDEPDVDDQTMQAAGLAAWRAALLDSGIVGESAEARLPLVLDTENRLYFAKYHAFEEGIARGLLARAVTNPVASDAAIERTLDTHFSGVVTPGAGQRRSVGSHASRNAAGGADPYQRAAARAALTRQLAVITGGPGTGKTTTVAKILAAMVSLAVEAGRPLPRIRLAAPTGKAAARLGESLRAAKARISDASIAARIPEAASTLHRLIGTRPNTRRPRHDAANPLALDVLVIDEASMIDAPLMARVIAALPPQARLVLLGDADQLASVEAGAVLGDICGGALDGGSAQASRRVVQDDFRQRDIGSTSLPGKRGVTGDLFDDAFDPGWARSPMCDSIARLVTSHRFDADRGIGALAQAINAGFVERALRVCRSDPAVTLVSSLGTDALKAVVAAGVDAFRGCLATSDVVEATRRFGAFRVLCALREGPWGVEAIAAAMERSLVLAGLVDPGKRHWRGRPLLITANDYGVELFNGDIGLVWPDDDGALRACFVAPDGKVKRLPLNRLPAHETALAMTVHKAQGSEFDRVALVLPERDAPVLTRELVYTAVTRARHAVDIYGAEELVAQAIRRRVSRSSGLRDALWA